MSQDNRSGTCITEKVRYADDAGAAVALARVQEARRIRPDGKPPERIFYHCSECDGWHLSSKPPDLAAEHQPKADGETWEEYAHRLERRIKEQRDQLESVNALRADAGNRAERKRIAHLRYALGMTDENRELLERGQRALDLAGARVVDARAVRGAVVVELAFRGTDDGAASLTVPLDGIHFWDEEESA